MKLIFSEAQEHRCLKTDYNLGIVFVAILVFLTGDEVEMSTDIGESRKEMRQKHIDSPR